jgi:hypothetical protein
MRETVHFYGLGVFDNDRASRPIGFAENSVYDVADFVLINGGTVDCV